MLIQYVNRPGVKIRLNGRIGVVEQLELHPNGRTATVRLRTEYTGEPVIEIDVPYDTDVEILLGPVPSVK